MQLSKMSTLTKLATGSTGVTTKNEAVDMAGYEGVYFFATGGTTATAVTITIAHGATTTGFVNVSGGTKASTGGSAVVGVDVYKPVKRYVRATASSTASSRIELIALQYGAKEEPLTAPTYGLSLVSPTS